MKPINAAVIQAASNWEIAYREHPLDPTYYGFCEALARAVDRLRAPGYRNADRKAKP